MDVTLKEKIIVDGVYRHFKGRFYKVLNLATHSESKEPMVVYQALYGDGAVWGRPAAMWLEEVQPGVRRFEFDTEAFAC